MAKKSTAPASKVFVTATTVTSAPGQTGPEKLIGSDVRTLVGKWWETASSARGAAD